MAQHTPGPWMIGDESRGDDPRMVYCDDATGQRVADCTGKYLFHSQEMMRANARLIAAAPDMLAALKQAELLIGNGRTVSPGSHEHRLILAAIRKAEGRS